jgi:hypothetical protein
MANKLFEIEIQEILCRVVKIKAKSYNSALDKIREKYTKCEIVLDYNDFVDVSYQDINKQSAEDEKNKLILEIIDYLYNDEKTHYLASSETARKNHIHCKLKRLKTLCKEVE